MDLAGSDKLRGFDGLSMVNRAIHEKYRARVIGELIADDFREVVRRSRGLCATEDAVRASFGQYLTCPSGMPRFPCNFRPPAI